MTRAPRHRGGRIAARAAVLALAAGFAVSHEAGAAPALAGRVKAAADASASPPAVAAPKRFVTRRALTLKGRRIAYTAIAAETYLTDGEGEPTASIFSFSYLKDGPREPSRPVLFVFNGGPGSASIWLHIGVVGPRRVVLDRGVDPSNVPPFGLEDNPDSLLDAADLVFIDPVGTGFSRIVGKGRAEDFYSVDGDADSVAQFIERWLTEHGRWNAPKFVMGESYGSIRAAVLPRALMGGPFYVGVMRGITLNGIVLLGTTLGARTPRSPAETAATTLPSFAATAWYHGKVDRAGRSLDQFTAEAAGFARSDYAAAAAREVAGGLEPAERSAVATRLAAYTGLPASKFAASLALPSGVEFEKLLLADRGLAIGAYDSRYTLPLANSLDDPVSDDPAMGRYVPGFIAAFHQMLSDDLQVRMDRPYVSIEWKTVNRTFNYERKGVPANATYAVDLANAMRRQPKLRVLVAAGSYDLVTLAEAARKDLMAARPPTDRVSFKTYPSGHMLYLGDTAPAFADDVRALIQAAK